MKILKLNLIFVFFFALIANFSFAQKQLQVNKTAEQAVAPHTVYQFKKCSPMTSMLLAEYNQHRHLESEKLAALLNRQFVVQVKNNYRLCRGIHQI